MDYKQVIVVRSDLKLPKGKLAAQVAHASVSSVLKSDKKIVSVWDHSGMKKIVVEVSDEKELFQIKKFAEEKHIVTALITDAGKTVVAPGTITCLGIGPDIEDKVDEVTGKLKMV